MPGLDAGARDDAADRRRARLVYSRLERCYPQPRRSPRRRPFPTVVGVILSAQCTGTRVERVLPALLDRYPDAARLARARIPTLEALIRPCGLQRAKSRQLRALSRALARDHRGRVPADRAALEALPGVGPKSASFVLANAFGQHALTVDTHVARLAYRLGFAARRGPRAAERALTRLVAPARWNTLHFLLIAHGRAVCRARGPRCGDCRLRDLCPQRGICG